VGAGPFLLPLCKSVLDVRVIRRRVLTALENCLKREIIYKLLNTLGAVEMILCHKSTIDILRVRRMFCGGGVTR